MARAALYTGLCFVTATTCHRKSRKLLKPAHPREVGSSIRRARTSPAHVLKKTTTLLLASPLLFPLSHHARTLVLCTWQRFAALLMLSKAVPEGDLDAIQEVYQVTGVGFISRLLHTTAVPAGCPPDAYQAIAASLLGSFAASPAVASEPAVLELAEPLLEMLEPVPAASAAFTADDAPRQAQQQPAPAPLPSQTDAVEALAGMAATPEGRACLLRAVADRQLAEFVSRPESQVAPEAAIAGLRALSLLAADRSGGGAGGGGGIRCSGDRVCKAANAMAACFSIRKDRGTLEAAELLIALLDHVSMTVPWCHYV